MHRDLNSWIEEQRTERETTLLSKCRSVESSRRCKPREQEDGS
jgi:hypothetical protein